MRPILHVIAGPNGAGKSTLYATAIAERFPRAEFVNAHVMAAQHFGHPARTQAEAAYGQGAAKARRAELLATGCDLVAKTVFSHASKLDLVRAAQAGGHEVRLYHVHVATADLAWKRIGRRVDEGGHDVPEDKARKRYVRNQTLIRDAVHLADRGYVFDNSTFGTPARRVLEYREGSVVYVGERLPAWTRELYREDLTAYSPRRLNAAAESFATAQGIVERQLGPGATLYIARRERGAAYEGRLIGTSELHLVQRLSAMSAVAHFRAAFREPPPFEAAEAIVFYTGREAELIVLDRPVVRAERGRRYEGQIITAGWPGVLQRVGAEIVRHPAEAFGAGVGDIERGAPAVIEYGDAGQAARAKIGQAAPEAAARPKARKR